VGEGWCLVASGRGRSAWQGRRTQVAVASSEMNHLLRLLASARRLFPLRLPHLGVFPIFHHFPVHFSGLKPGPRFCRGFQRTCVHGTLPWQNTNQNPGSGRGLPLFFVAFCFGKSLPEFSAKVFLVSFFYFGNFWQPTPVHECG